MAGGIKGTDAVRVEGRATVKFKLAVAVFGGDAESVTLTAKDDVSSVVGVPLIWPELLRFRPAGSDPEVIDQL